MSIIIKNIRASRQAIDIKNNCWSISLHTDFATEFNTSYYEQHLRAFIQRSWETESITWIGAYSDADDFDADIWHFYVQFKDDAAEAEFLITKDKAIGENI